MLRGLISGIGACRRNYEGKGESVGRDGGDWSGEDAIVSMGVAYVTNKLQV